MSDLLLRPAAELAGLVRSGELSARELVQASLDRIDELNPSLNAFVDVIGDEALATADGIARATSARSPASRRDQEQPRARRPPR